MENLDESLKILTYYHTTIRNMALYASVAFAALVYSRFHRGKNFVINVALILSSISFTLLSITIGYFLNQDLKEFEKTQPQAMVPLQKWYFIPNALTFTNYIILLVTIYVFFIQFK